MIVKRVAEALKRQDWAAVAIEFTLVLAGVLLAFQIDEWATEREARAEHSAATLRLLGEAEESVAYMRAGVTTQQQLLAGLDYTLGHIQEGTWRAADRDRMTNALLGLINAAPPAPPTSVYDDLIASGMFGKIGDVQMRAAVADYRGSLDFNGRYVEYFRQRIPNFETYDAIRYIYARDRHGRSRLEVDFPALVRDGQLQEKLALTTGGHEIMLRVRQRTLKSAEAMCVQIGRVARRTCDLHRPVPSFT